MENWKGKHILVVGASEGIGKETALLNVPDGVLGFL